MDRSEPTLIPEWLKNSGSVTRSSYVNHQSAFCLHSVDHPISKHARNKSSANGREHGLSRSVFSDRTTSSYFRRSTNPKDSAHLRSYSSFNRSNRERSWDEFDEYVDKDKSILGDQSHREYSDNPSGALSEKSGKDTLRRSQSLITRNLDATSLGSSRKINGDSCDMRKSRHNINKTPLHPSGSVQSSMLTAFGRDFPSLGTENKPSSSELRRVPSPGTSAAVQTFSTSSSSIIGVDGWTSPLAEVPGLIGSSGSGQNLLSPQATSGISAPLSQRANGLNMAEAVAQGPSRARTPPQASIDTQKLEELAIKQSRQLIPVIPSMPKTVSLGPLEKLKTKTVQQQAQLSSPNQGNHQNVRSGAARMDAGKSLNLGKLQFLKPSRELSSVSSINSKESSLSPKNVMKVVHSGQTPSSVVAAAPNVSPVKTRNLTERKQPLASSTIPEKKPPLLQSRSDFFKLLKKKSSATTNTCIPDKCNGGGAQVAADASCVDSSAADNGGKIETNNGEGCCKEEPLDENGEVEEPLDADVPYPDEKEAAFLRSLGWEECAGEDEGLTEDEIKAFYEYMKLRPTSEEAKGFQQQQQQQQLKVNNGRCVSST